MDPPKLIIQDDLEPRKACIPEVEERVDEGLACLHASYSMGVTFILVIKGARPIGTTYPRAKKCLISQQNICVIDSIIGGAKR